MLPAGVRRLARLPGFRALWLGQLVSIFGDRFHYLALLALVVARASHPANPAPELAVIPLVSFLPAILFGPVAGPLVDRWNVKRVLVVSDAIRGGLVLLLIPAAARGGMPAAFALVFALYVANFGSYNKVYGSLAAVIIFLIWMWISNTAVLIGAEFNAELERGRAIAGGHPPDAEPFTELRDTRKLPAD